MGLKNISMREHYEKIGVDNYYKGNAIEYKNLHEPQIKELLTKNIDKINGSVLDLSCGGGEVTKVLLDNNTGIMDIRGVDPYTCELYKKNTGRHCTTLSFKDIMNGSLTKKYDVIICSFALHLVDEKDLFMLVNELFRHTKILILIAPHKRPFIDKVVEGVDLTFTDHALTPKGKKVYLRIYEKEKKIDGDIAVAGVNVFGGIGELIVTGVEVAAMSL